MKAIVTVALAVALSACGVPPEAPDAALPDSGVESAGEWRLTCGVRLEICPSPDDCRCPERPPSVVVDRGWCDVGGTLTLEAQGADGALTAGPFVVGAGAPMPAPDCTISVEVGDLQTTVPACDCAMMRQSGGELEVLLQSCTAAALRVGSFTYTAEVGGLITFRGCT